MLSRKEALQSIETGHAIYAPSVAAEICEALGVSFPKSLVQVYESDGHPLGVTMYRGPAAGVWSLELSRHVAECLGVKEKARGFLGRGSQAREYARLVKEALGVRA